MKLIVVLFVIAAIVMANAANLGKKSIVSRNNRDQRWGDVPANRIKTCVYSRADSGCTAPLVCIRSYAAQCVNLIDGSSVITFLNGTAVGSANVYFYPGTDCETTGTPVYGEVGIRTCAAISNPNTALNAGLAPPYVQVFTYGTY